MPTWLIILITGCITFTAGAGFGYWTRAQDEQEGR